MSTATQPLTDRKEAGFLLATRLQRFKNQPNTLVLALPRGGVEVGAILSIQLNLPLDVFLTRKLGFPNDPECALGALTETGLTWLNPELFSHDSRKEIPYQHYLDHEILRQQEEIERQQALYRKGKKLRPLDALTVILVDDGVATGSTFIASLHSLRTFRIKRLIAAIPVAPPETIKHIRTLVDELEVLDMPEFFVAVGSSYQFFSQVEDQQVLNYLKTANERLRYTTQGSLTEQKAQQRSAR
jgi:predicted phosphoribosyltransferase